MPSTTRLSNKTSTEQITQLWATRYVPDLSTLYSQANGFTILELLKAASPDGRAKTVAQLKRVLQITCESAEIKTATLFAYIPNVVNLTEAERIAEFATKVYHKALCVYGEKSPPTELLARIPSIASLNPVGEAIDLGTHVFEQSVMPALELPAIEQLAAELEPLLVEHRQQLSLAKDTRAMGFMSTQFHFSTSLMLNRLTPPEQVLLSPYFKFVEEQISIPWQRICAAVAPYKLNSPLAITLLQLLPASHEIACAAYNRAVHLYPNYRSRRGALSDPGVKASTIRDLEMFQAYLWLCILEGNMKAIQEELLPLCLMVFPSIDITWELVQQMLSLLVDEFIKRVSDQYEPLLLLYTQAMQNIFSDMSQSSISCPM